MRMSKKVIIALSLRLTQNMHQLQNTQSTYDVAISEAMRRHARVSVFDIALERQLERYLKEFCNDR